jgi:hypothetical protein
MTTKIIGTFVVYKNTISHSLSLLISQLNVLKRNAKANEKQHRVQCSRLSMYNVGKRNTAMVKERPVALIILDLGSKSRLVTHTL